MAPANTVIYMRDLEEQILNDCIFKLLAVEYLEPVKHVTWRFSGKLLRDLPVNCFCKKIHRRCLTGY